VLEGQAHTPTLLCWRVKLTAVFLDAALSVEQSSDSIAGAMPNLTGGECAITHRRSGRIPEVESTQRTKRRSLRERRRRWPGRLHRDAGCRRPDHQLTRYRRRAPSIQGHASQRASRGGNWSWLSVAPFVGACRRGCGSLGHDRLLRAMISMISCSRGLTIPVSADPGVHRDHHCPWSSPSQL
jgi:hypothetical protein